MHPQNDFFAFTLGMTFDFLYLFIKYEPILSKRKVCEVYNRRTDRPIDKYHKNDAL